MLRGFSARQLAPLGVSGFRLLFLSTLGSSLGTLLAAIALAIDVKDRTNSGLWVGAVLIVEFLPTIVIGLTLGPLLDRLETDPTYDAGFHQTIVTAYRKIMQVIRAAPDERVFYNLKSMHFEKLKGNRSSQHSMRLNKQWRLIIEFEGAAPNKLVAVISIEDYH